MTTLLPETAGRPLSVPGDPAAVALFSGRDPALPGAGNVSVVVGGGRPQAARRAILGAIGLTPGDAVFMEQVHGAGVAEVGAADRGRGCATHGDAVPGVDALVTREAEVAVVVMVADCVPVLLVDPGRTVAAVHAGRRGVGDDVVGAAIAAMDPPDPARIHAFIGPSIGGCCYEVPDALADEVAGKVPEADARTTWGTRSLDLPAAVLARLTRLGVSSVTRSEACTHCGPGEWFSHRRVPGEGRQVGVVCRRSRPWQGGGHANPSLATGTSGRHVAGKPREESPVRSVDWDP